MVSSILTEVIGIHALFGAFLLGAILPKEGKLAESLIEKLESVAVVLLLPLFFAYSGLRTQIGLVTTPTDWLVTLLLIVVATAGKFGGSSIAAYLTGLKWREAAAIGILMNTRGLMELIVLNVGLDLGVISPTVFTMLVIMALVTTFVTTPILRIVYPDRELAGERVAEPVTTRKGDPEPFTLMMCVSDPRLGPALATLAAALTGRRETSARLFALHLWRPSDRPSVEHRRLESESDTDALQPLLSRARDMDLEVRPVAFVSNDPAADICRTAEAMEAGLVLLGAHKPLLLEGTLGGKVREVVSQAQMPVGVLIDRGLESVKSVLVAYAGGAEDRAAIEIAHRLVARSRARMTLLHVVSPDDVRDGRGRTQVDEVFDEPDAESGVRVLVVEHPSPPDAVLEESRRGYDLLVLGMRAQWGLDTGVSLRRKRVIEESTVSILAVHPPRIVDEVAPAERGREAV
jgi:hypothetical protein